MEGFPSITRPLHICRSEQGKLRLDLETRKRAVADLARLRADLARNGAPHELTSPQLAACIVIAAVIPTDQRIAWRVCSVP